jgi:alpha-L-arabinofuranosidase
MPLSTRYIQSWCAVFFLFLITAFLNAPLDSFAQTTAPTNIQVTSSYVQPSVTRLGINLGDQDSYDSGQMMKNLIFGNSGFEGMKYRSVLHCVTVTANSCTDGNTYSDQPSGFWTGGTYLVVSGAQFGMAGNVVSSVMIPEACSLACGQQLITFDKSLSLAVGDYVVVTNNFPGDAQEGWVTYLSGAATVATDLNDLSPETPGKQALEVTATGANDSATISHGFDTTNGHTFIQMNGTYAVTFRAKGVGGTNILNVNLERLTAGWTYFLNQNVQLSNQWANYTLTFTANENGSAIGPILFNFQVAQSAVLLDDVSVTQTNSDPTNTTAFRDDVVNTLKTLQPGTIRMNTTAAIGADLYDQIATPFARYREGAFTNSAVAYNLPYGITEFLQLCAAVGADPWLTIPTATTPQEITDFMDYLTGNGSTTYSAIRVAEGQVAPWTTVFNTIHIELGNETWNTGFAGNSMAYPAYPQWANQVFGAARKSPNFDPSKFDLVLSGWAINPGYSNSLLSYSTQQDSISIAPYIADSVNTASTASMFQALFAEPEWVDNPGGSVYQNAAYAMQQMTSASGTAKPTKIGVYEVNLSTLSGTITQAQTNQFVPSVGAGVALADHMLQMMRLGISTQNSFELPGFENSGTNGNTVPVYGLVVDMGPNNYRRPSFLAEALANTAIQGSLLATVQTGANPTWNQPLSTDGVVLSGAHEIQSFAFLNGTSHSVVLFNLSVSNSLPVTFSGPNAPSGTVQVSQLTSANITDDNETSNTVQTTTTTASISPTVPYNLPPYSMTVLSWTGPGTLTGPAQAAAPVFGLAAGTYSTPQSVTISDSTQGAVIYYTTDGSTPTTSSTQYTGPLTVGLSQTIRAIAVVPFYLNSPVVTATFTIQVQDVNYSGGFDVSQAQMVLNGTAQFSGSILQLTSATTANAAGSAWYYLPANIQSFTNDFTFQMQGANANGFTFTVQNQGTSAEGMWGLGLGYEYITPSVAITFDLWNSSGDSIGIFTNGATPTTPSVDLSSTGINLHDSHAKAVHMVYDGANLVMTITDTVNNKSYTTTFPINLPGIIGQNAALVGFTGGTGGQTATQQILAWNFSSTGSQTTATPTFSVAAGSYTAAQTVTIADATAGAAIYYTTNGTIPTTSSTKYTGPITVSSTETLEAIAVAPGDTNSAVGTAAYTINSPQNSANVAAPTFSEPGGAYGPPQAVQLADATAGVTIYYTTDGTTPTASSPNYWEPIYVGHSQTIKAIAILAGSSGSTSSAIVTATYTIGATSQTAARKSN